MMLKVARLTPTAQLPKRGSPLAAGLDLHYDGPEVTIQPGEKHILGTGLALAIPAHLYGRVAPRSGLAAKKGLQIMAGVVDADYRGEVKIVTYLIPSAQESLTVYPGDRIAQLILERCELLYPFEVASVSELEASDRGEGGFGSTGN